MRWTANDDEDMCVLCQTPGSSSTNLTEAAKKLLTSKLCGHKFHRRCCDLSFGRQNQFKCPPPCGMGVSRQNLMEQSLDELECETDVGVRKQVKKTYNLARENFDSLREFQDYEEEVEDIIFSLVHGDDNEKEQAKRKMKEYGEKNAQSIAQQAAQHSATHDREEKIIEEASRKQEQARQKLLEEKSEAFRRKKQAQRERNAAALGETATGIGGSVAGTFSAHLAHGMQGTDAAVEENREDGVPVPDPPVQTAPNLLAAFLGARDLPNWVYPADKAERSGRKQTREEYLKAREAAGYDSRDASRRDIHVLGKLMTLLEFDT